MSKHLASFLNGLNGFLGAGHNRRSDSFPTPRVNKDRLWHVRPKTDVQVAMRQRDAERS